MASVNFDSRTLSIDGKRIWLVSGSIHFQRTPRAQWVERIRAARHAGLNCVETPIFWSEIEPRPGSYDFKDNNDIRHFVELVAQAGMHCVLRVGPYIGEGWDLGGLPAWLLNMPGLKVRCANQPYLEAVGKYFNVLAKQVKDLQATVTRGGPIIMIQNEAQWNCGDPEAAKGYLGELGRYLREAGLTVPKINANNLWQGVEGDIDGWSGSGDMFGVMRQLHAVRPDQPEIVIDCGAKARPAFSHPHPECPDGLTYQRQLAAVMCAGGQFNLGNFSSGTTFGFHAGSSPSDDFAPYTPTQDACPIIDEHARLTEHGKPVRRLTMFASSFSRVLANTEHEDPPIIIDPDSDDNAIAGHVVTHMRGSQGSVVFIFSPAKAKPGTVNLLLPDGARLPVRLGHQRVQWCLLDTNLSSAHSLDYTSLNALAANDKMLVLFGPANGLGEVSINGTPLELEVPKGRKPLVVDHDGITLVVMSDEMADETYIHEAHVFVGVGGLTDQGEPIPSPHGKTHTHIDPNGVAKTHSTKVPAGYPGEKLPRVNLNSWQCAVPEEHIDGSSPRYAQIPGPADLSELGTPYGYGWYKVAIKNASGKKLKLRAPESADRVAVFLDGEHQGVLGSGPGADRVIQLATKKGDQQLVMLADNMGRVDSGTDMTARKGVYGHLIEDTAFKIGKSSIIQADPVDILAFKSPVFGLQPGDTTLPDRIAWSFKHLKKSSIFFELPAFPVRAMVILNDEPLRLIEPGRHHTLVLDAETIKRGNNDLHLAFENNAISEDGEAFVKEMHKLINDKGEFIEGANAITDKCDWSFAKWEPPAEIDFDGVAKSRMSDVSQPAWWKSNFETPDSRVALSLDTAGLSKGQVYINAKPLGRYFTATADGAGVEPAMPLAIPSSWLNKSGVNEMLIFDEHGASPAKAKIIVEHS